MANGTQLTAPNDWYQNYIDQIAVDLTALNGANANAKYRALDEQLDAIFIAGMALNNDATYTREFTVFAAVDAYRNWKREANRLLAAVTRDVRLSNDDYTLLTKCRTPNEDANGSAYEIDQMDRLMDWFLITQTTGSKRGYFAWQTTAAGLRLLELNTEGGTE